MKRILSILLEEARWPFKLAFTLAIVLIFINVTSCAPLSKAERASCATGDYTEVCINALIEQKEYNREARRLEEYEAIVAFINGCDAAGGTLLVNSTWHSSRCRARKHGKELCIPKQARLIDYQCLSDRAVRDLLNGRSW